MKNLVIATSAVFGLAGLAEIDQADAGHKHGSHKHGSHKHGRKIAVRIVGGILHSVIHNSHRHGHSHRGHRGHIVRVPRRVIHHFHVKYHMHGSRTVHFHSHSLAHRYFNYLRGLGLHAKLIHSRGHYDVTYHVHGRRMRTFASHSLAHYFQQQLAKLGVHATVAHH